MDMSHLYHDANFGGPTIELDVKEQMRTREINAREERNFERVSKSYEKAKFICEKNTTWERWRVGQTLHTIWERTPRLERSLALEKARVEALQRELIRRSYPSVNASHDRRRELDVPSSPQVKASRSTPKGSRRRQREQVKRKRDKKEEGRPLNTDFSLDRHLHRQTDFSRRSEHVVKALARLNWRQESRRRDHMKFKEELIEFSKPVIDRARVVLKGRQGMDFEQFLDEFQNFFNRDDMSNVKRLSKNSRNKGGSKQSLTQQNIMRLDEDQDDSKPFLPSVTATSSTDLTIIGSNDAGYAHLENDEDIYDGVDGRVKNTELDNETNHSNSTVDLKQRSASEMKTDSICSLQKVETNSLLPGRHTEQAIQKSKKNSNEFHLPAISGLGPVPNGKDKPRRRAGSNDSGVLVHDNLSGKNSSLGSEVFSPSTSVSQVIVEEDEVGSITPTYNQRHQNFNTQQSHSVFFNDDSDKEDSEETKRLATTCTIGLPQLWKQPVRPQKEKPTVEVSASTIARKHRRRANSQRSW